MYRTRFLPSLLAPLVEEGASTLPFGETNDTEVEYLGGMSWVDCQSEYRIYPRREYFVFVCVNTNYGDKNDRSSR